MYTQSSGYTAAFSTGSSPPPLPDDHRNSSGYLNLAHSRTAPDARARVRTAASGEAGEDGGDEEGEEAEEEESGGCLALVAALRGAGGDVVAVEVVLENI